MTQRFSLDAINTKPKKKGRFAVSPIEQRTLDGDTFDSKGEMNRYAYLKQLLKAKQISNLARQPSFPVEINGKHICTYSADFSYFDEHLKRNIIEDVKSSGTAKDPYYRLRKKLAEAVHGIKVTEVMI